MFRLKQKRWSGTVQHKPAVVEKRKRESEGLWAHYGIPLDVRRFLEAGCFFFDDWGNLVADGAESVYDGSTGGWRRSYAYFDIDHLFPVVRGGQSVVGNLSAIFHGANREKGCQIQNAMRLDVPGAYVRGARGTMPMPGQTGVCTTAFVSCTVGPLIIESFWAKK